MILSSVSKRKQLTLWPKVKLFSWLLMRKRFQIRSRMHKFMPHIPPDCHVCNSNHETIDHLFISCSFASNIWSCVPDALLKPPPGSDLLSWLNMLSCDNNPQGPNHLSKAIMICSQIWEARNNLLFNDVPLIQLYVFTLLLMLAWITGTLTTLVLSLRIQSLISSGSLLALVGSNLTLMTLFKMEILLLALS